MYVIAIVIGILAGFGAVLFRGAIWFAQLLFFGPVMNPGNVEFSMTQLPDWLGGFSLTWVPDLYEVFQSLGPWRFVLLPAIGGLVVGLYISGTYEEVAGHGTERTLEAILVKGGKINPRIALHKTVASAVAIASGGSLGREGPIVQIGSAMGSYFGRFTDTRFTRVLVAAGGGAGIAATFNAPLAGTMFALEILLEEYYIHNVMAVAIACVMATAVARPLLHFTPLPGAQDFLVPIQFSIVNPFVEFPLYMLLGVIVALVGVLEVRSLYGVEDLFAELSVPGWVKPGIGGALLGLSALVMAVVFGINPLSSANWLFGVGYNTIHEAITGQFVFLLLLGLLAMKVVGFSLSIGSGSSGGVFSPSLFVGAMLGTAFGLVVHGLAPASTASAGAYALVGMAGVFAAAARAPLTATFIIFELSGQYTIILPLLLVSVLGSEIANKMLSEGTIYTEPLRRMGYTVQDRRIGSLEDLTPMDVMTAPVDTLVRGISVQEAIRRFRQTDHHGMPIVDESNVVVGMLTLSDLEAVLSGSILRAVEANDAETALEIEEETTVDDIGSMDVITAPPDTTLLAIVDKMESYDVGRVPIVDEGGHLLGIVTRSDILDAYDNRPRR